ncbi:hypothetical protein HDK77DRAFT_427471 [Phyllosticta capitalensis]
MCCIIFLLLKSLSYKARGLEAIGLVTRVIITSAQHSYFLELYTFSILTYILLLYLTSFFTLLTSYISLYTLLSLDKGKSNNLNLRYSKDWTLYYYRPRSATISNTIYMPYILSLVPRFYKATPLSGKPIRVVRISSIVYKLTISYTIIRGTSLYYYKD